jgi:hypothetical protein
MKRLFTQHLSIVKIILIAFTMMKANHTNATHIMGSDISWISLGDYKYEITLKLYRDCRGIPAYGDELTVMCANSHLGVLKFTMNKIEINDITRVCDSLPDPCTPENTIIHSLGMEEHVFNTVLDFNQGDLLTMRNNGCCRFNLAFSECCRNSISNNHTLTYGNFFTDAEIDICNINKSINRSGDNSPVFTNKPIRHICINTPLTYTNGTIEEDGDSLKFSLVSAITNMSVSANYIYPFSATWPMTVYCDTNPIPCNCDESNFPILEGFCFNDKGGEMSFIPTHLNQSGVIVVKVEQFRLDSNSNQWLNIGFVKREMQLIVLHCNENNPPFLNKLKDTVICAGDTICVDIKAMDLQYSSGQLWDDSLTLTWDEGAPGGYFTVEEQYNDTINNEVFIVKEAQLCWQTTDSLGRNAPYYFSVTASDKACPYKAFTTRSYSIKVDPCLPPDSTDNSDTGKLNNHTFIVHNSLRIYPNPVNDILVLETEYPIKYIKVFDNLGKLVIEKQNPQTLDFSNLNKGIYLLYGRDIHGNLLKNKVMKE